MPTTTQFIRRGRRILSALRAVHGLLPLLVPMTLPAQERVITGTVLVEIVDGERGESALETSIVDAAGRTTRLELSPAEQRRLGDPARLHGSRSTIRGQLIRTAPRVGELPPVETVAVSSVTMLTQPHLVDQTAGAVGTERWAVIGCRFPDIPTFPSNPVDWANLLGASAPGLEHYWMEVSNGRYSIAGSTSTRWFTLPRPWAEYHPDGRYVAYLLMNDCLSAADAELMLPEFAGFVMQFNGDLRGSIGSVSFAYVGAQPFTADGVTKSYRMAFMADWAAKLPFIWAHEMGHTLGMWHSGTSAGRPYDSYWDVMSYGGTYWSVAGTTWHVGVHPVAARRAKLGWIPEDRVFTAPPGTSQVTLERTALPTSSTGTLLARIPIPGTDHMYTLETRAFAGYDRPGAPFGLPGQGVIVHRYRAAGAFPSSTSDAFIVDTDGDGYVNDASGYLVPGESWRDPVTGIAVRVDQAPSPTSYRVTITRSGIHRATVAIGGSGRGRVTSTPVGIDCLYGGSDGTMSGTCTGEFAPGGTVTLSAVPEAGSRLVGWSGSCTGMTCVLDMSADRSVRAEFTSECTVSASPIPQTGGTVTFLQGGATGTCGRQVVLEATPASGHAFLGWFENGRLVVSTAAWGFAPATNRILEARFQSQCTLQVQAAPTDGGSTVIHAGGASGPCGRPVTVLGRTHGGWLWLGWYEGGTRVSADSQWTFTLAGNRAIEGRFARTCAVRLTATPPAGGSVALKSGQARGPCGEPITISASSASGYLFLGWFSRGVLTPRPIETTMTLEFDLDLEARFGNVADLSRRLFDQIVRGVGQLEPWELVAVDLLANRSGRLDLGDLLFLIDKHPDAQSGDAQGVSTSVLSPRVPGMRHPRRTP